MFGIVGQFVSTWNDGARSVEAGCWALGDVRYVTVIMAAAVNAAKDRGVNALIVARILLFHARRTSQGVRAAELITPWAASLRRSPMFGKLEIDVTVDDPKSYTKPFMVRINRRVAVDEEPIEFA